MKTLLSLSLVAACLASSPMLHADDALPGFVDLGDFSSQVSGSRFVEVNIGPALIGMVARLTEGLEPEATALLRGLKAVRVNVIGITDANRAEMDERIQRIRADLNTRGWERIVAVRENLQDIGVYLKQRGEEAIEGVVVTVLDGKGEAVFVNIVGDIRPEKIAVVAEKLNIGPLKKVAESLKKS